MCQNRPFTSETLLYYRQNKSRLWLRETNTPSLIQIVQPLGNEIYNPSCVYIISKWQLRRSSCNWGFKVAFVPSDRVLRVRVDARLTATSLGQSVLPTYKPYSWIFISQFTNTEVSMRFVQGLTEMTNVQRHRCPREGNHSQSRADNGNEQPISTC